MKARKRYVQVGVGSRGWCYTAAMVKTMSKYCELVGICDTNPGRMELCNRRIQKELGGTAVAMFPAAEFDAMLRRLKPDVVVVTSMDSTHDDYIVRAMRHGCDVICEKPMTIDERKCRRIMDAIKRTGRDLKVTFNCRYMPPMLQVKDLLMKGVVGRILSADVQWMLDLSHGASYFRRWHSEKANSGGLLLHKATHHLDLVNWYLSANPVEVFAMGDRSFYGSDSALIKRYGLERRGENCLKCSCAKKCPFYVDLMKSDHSRRLYVENQKHDGYVPARCIFHKRVDIMDTMNLVVKYDTGAFLSYSLNAFLPYEGFRFVFNGDRGRLEYESIGAPTTPQGKVFNAEKMPQGMRLRLYPHFRPAREIPPVKFSGGHWGGDSRMMADLFSGKQRPDKYLRAAGFAGGAMSILIGAAANKSIRTGRPIKIASLVKDLPKPDLPKMKA
ncbi:MAG: Gfo/Idh/MocA family oxidoreductase [Kiritimatiellia bacterium]|jgi:predicted dehydrogenase